MDAGNVMKFAEPTVRPENVEIDADERRAVYVQFDRLCKMLELRATSFNSHANKWPYQEGYAEVFGAYYQQDMPDGSYLWIDYSTGTQDEKDKQAVITVEEHAPDATLLKSYKFIVKNETVYYDGGQMGDAENRIKEHSSTYGLIAILTLTEYNAKHGRGSERASAQSGLAMFDNDASNEYLKHRLGYGYRPMKLDEIQKLRDVLRQAVPAPVKDIFA